MARRAEPPPAPNEAWRQAALDAGARFDAERADRVVAFFHRYLRHAKGERAGQPFALEPWQADRVLRPAFGWVRSDGTRLVRYLFLAVPRKNGKSTLAAGIGLYLLTADDEPGAEVFSAAADREQAAIVYDTALSMRGAHPALAKRVRPYASAKRMVVSATGSLYRCLSADAYTKHGLNAHGVLFDELHAQPNTELWDVLTTATGARRQPMVVAITTAGFDRGSLCWREWQRAAAMLEGQRIDPTTLPVVYAAPPDAPLDDPATWALANPNLGVSLKPGYMREAAARALESAAEENAFRRLHLNQWTQQDVRWLRMDRWDACADPAVTLEALTGRPCYVGLDLSSTSDLTACVAVFPDDGNAVLTWAWVPAGSVELRSRREGVPYQEWVRDGHLYATDGDRVDYDAVREHLRALSERVDIREVAVDPWNSQQLQTQLLEDGFSVVKFPQRFATMSSPAKLLERMVLDSTLRHDGNPVLRWAAGNVAVRVDPMANIMPDKKRSTEKIDPVVALVMALGRAEVRTTPEVSVYRSGGPGLFVL